MSPLQRTILDRELNELLEDISKLFSMTDQALANAMLALQKQDVPMAQEVVAGDERVNDLRYQIEFECLRILATQQPRAGDLRLTVASTHIANELERIADHAVGIAEVVIDLGSEEMLSNLHNALKMEKHARYMLQLAVRSFLDRDPEVAEGILRREQKLDRHYNELVALMLTQLQDNAYIRQATDLLWVGRHLQRVGDRATNIAERVIFTVTGKFVEIA